MLCQGVKGKGIRKVDKFIQIVSSYPRTIGQVPEMGDFVEGGMSGPLQIATSVQFEWGLKLQIGLVFFLVLNDVIKMKIASDLCKAVVTGFSLCVLLPWLLLHGWTSGHGGAGALSHCDSILLAQIVPGPGIIGLKCKKLA